MLAKRHLALIAALALAIPAVAGAAQPQWGAQPAFTEGYQNGQLAGVEDARRGDSFQFADESDYRRGDLGFNPRLGNRERYRIDFRRGFEQGYRVGYDRYGYDSSRSRFGSSWPSGRGPGRGDIRLDFATRNGHSDGYEAGFSDGGARRRFDPIAESRYRSGDHGYERGYGPRELYKDNYRDGFRLGYTRGYEDAQPYR